MLSTVQGAKSVCIQLTKESRCPLYFALYIIGSGPAVEIGDVCGKWSSKKLNKLKRVTCGCFVIV